ncbi:hypothetical protein SAMD00019534_073140 [Acytostelium subglobosum LB1]|uniref:hypothetical protein n=1 Tax=Acytostelium subglobosum LB1 TaxID=1410327 RepID=UPI000644F21D|nr:hypothetical protein SAMD00019534_073140 [Acytostelium subglobosum LB1]GAM24139.1 hypothetical protein SAMD00019534_073140 [Acytostelium subglobosum LB1]|eukprot:XP_012753175.1 hypothetical protein SAMD00019534_073140 [Acytostelium subglobosum LB1]
MSLRLVEVVLRNVDWDSCTDAGDALLQQASAACICVIARLPLSLGSMRMNVLDLAVTSLGVQFCHEIISFAMASSPR